MNKKNKYPGRNNQFEFIGTLDGEFQFEHQIGGQKIYCNKLRIERLKKDKNSGAQDILPIRISEDKFKKSEFWGHLVKGLRVRGKGQLRTYDKIKKDGTRYLDISVMIREMQTISYEERTDLNSIILKGYVCKQPIYRLKNRSIKASTRKIKSKELEITELLLAINRCCGKTDYIPCICWNKNARRASEFKVGEHIMIEGEVHSREYLKRHNSKKTNNLNYIVEHRIAYEVFTTKLEVIQEK